MNWKIKKQNPKLQTEMSNALGVHPAIAQLLINRNIKDIDDAKHFLSAELSDLHDPSLMKGMTSTVQRIEDARKKSEKVLVFGDYDVDGVLSSVLLHNVLKEMGVCVINWIPHRVDEGYGLNHEIAEYAKEQGVKLIITVDCGISAKDEVDTINSMGIDVIIIDHHLPEKDRIPNACAVIDPRQKDCNYPFKDLASVGLVSKLIQCLKGEIDDDALGLAAIGTVADVVPLRGENRIFVKNGLPKINKTSNKGLLALLDVTKIREKKLLPFHVGFILGPRINAAGRMDSAHTSLDLFLSSTTEEARNLAGELEVYNSSRQKMQKEMIQEAIAIVEQDVDFKDQEIIVVSKRGWHPGILGIVSSRITEKYYRPSIVISVNEEGIGVASCRSIAGFHLHNALSACSDCLEEFGGHKGAAGLTIKADNILEFTRVINEFAEKNIEFEKLTPTVDVDCQIAINTIDLEFANVVNSMEPYGEGNPAPFFCSKNLSVKGVPRILSRDTLKFWVTDGDCSISVIGFGMGDFLPIVKSKERIDLVYNVSIDDWNKAPTPQLKLKDVKISE